MIPDATAIHCRLAIVDCRLSISDHSLMRRRSRGNLLVACVVLVLTAGLIGCVRRTMTITTEPPGAMVFLNDQEIGRSEVTTDFLWYGDYGVTLRKKGYETLKTHWEVKPPWYQYMPIDFFAEVLWPGHIHDTRDAHFVLQPKQLPTSEELVSRAAETRERALDRRK